MATRAGNIRTRTTLETARLRLEPWDDAHFELFASFMRVPEVIRYIRREPFDRERALEHHERSLADWDVHGFGKRAIFERATDRWLGFAELSLVGPRKGSRDDDVELGYFIEPARWGEGIATEAALEVRDEAFGRCALGELVGRCRVENVASLRVLEKVGFKRLRLFELDDGVVVEIHHLRRDQWDDDEAGRRQVDVGDASPGTGVEYRETG
jgi:RimJ/RimL family protein N-acetyltransferase